MSDNADAKSPMDNGAKKFQIEIQPRRPSFTSRLLGANREWMSSYYQSQEEDDQQYGLGFNDQADDFIGGVLANGRRRRNSSMSSDDSFTIESNGNRERTGSISERVAGMQVMTKPSASTIDTKKSASAHKFVGDINDMSVLF